MPDSKWYVLGFCGCVLFPLLLLVAVVKPSMPESPRIFHAISEVGFCFNLHGHNPVPRTPINRSAVGATMPAGRNLRQGTPMSLLQVVLFYGICMYMRYIYIYDLHLWSSYTEEAALRLSNLQLDSESQHAVRQFSRSFLVVIVRCATLTFTCWWLVQVCCRYFTCEKYIILLVSSSLDL